MNLVIIKQRFVRFVRSFEQQDVDLAMQYVELIMSEYRKNPKSFLGKCHDLNNLKNQPIAQVKCNKVCTTNICLTYRSDVSGRRCCNERNQLSV